MSSLQKLPFFVRWAIFLSFIALAIWVLDSRGATEELRSDWLQYLATIWAGGCGVYYATKPLWKGSFRADE